MRWIRLATSCAVSCAVLIVVTPDARAQEALATDRPQFTETSLAIPRGKLQLETGALFDQADGISGRRGPELMVRFGLLPRTEARVGYNHSWESADGKGENSGLFHVGAKIQIAPEDAAWGASVIPTFEWDQIETTIEDADADAAFGLIFTWAHNWNERWNLSGILGPVWGGIDGEGDDSVLATASAGARLDQRTGTFLEWAAQFPQSSGESAHTLHHGYTYLLTGNAQMDIHGGIGLTEAARDWFIGVGLAYRAPN